MERLGLRPFLLVEWKQMLRDAGVVDLQVQDWTAGADGSDEPARPPESLLTWREKMHIVGRAWRRQGWREARGAVASEMALMRELFNRFHHLQELAARAARITGPTQFR